MSEVKCTSWRGHAFEARYTRTPPSIKDLSDSRLTSINPRLIESLSAHVYECDVCVRCGHVVQKPQT